jgi:hypothetical protein
MQRAQSFDREIISHHWTNHPVTAVLYVSQAVAMLDAYVPAPELSIPRFSEVFDTNIFAKNLTAPAVMISGDPENFNTTVSEIGKRRNGSKSCAWNDRLPLEPEVEKVSIDDQGFRPAWQCLEEP